MGLDTFSLMMRYPTLRGVEEGSEACRRDVERPWRDVDERVVSFQARAEGVHVAIP